MVVSFADRAVLWHKLTHKFVYVVKLRLAVSQMLLSFSFALPFRLKDDHCFLKSWQVWLADMLLLVAIVVCSL